MSEYIPTTEQIRHAYCDGLAGTSRTRGESAGEFNRWLAEVERAAAEKGWDEGADAIAGSIWDNERTPKNPYRREDKSGE